MTNILITLMFNSGAHGFNEVYVIRRKRAERIKQADKICCCVLLNSTHSKNVTRNFDEKPHELYNAKISISPLIKTVPLILC